MFFLLRSQLNTKCRGYEQAIVSQANTPVGTKMVYDGERKRSLQVTAEIFSTFVKVSLFLCLPHPPLCSQFMHCNVDETHFYRHVGWTL